MVRCYFSRFHEHLQNNEQYEQWNHISQRQEIEKEKWPFYLVHPIECVYILLGVEGVMLVLFRCVLTSCSRYWPLLLMVPRSHGRVCAVSLLSEQCTVGDAFTEHGVIGKIFFQKIFVTPSVFKLQKWFLHQNGVECKSKSNMWKLQCANWQCVDGSR